jgi:hypothetical protein
MSLHTLANHLQQAGRGDDKILVHMTPKEVGGLQSLAMAHGGSLSINPQTGLPEAGILGKLLPSVLGFALGPAGMGLMTATQAGLASGVVGTLATGSLSKGIMAGLGAYGGASLGGSLMNAGSALTPVDFGAGVGKDLGTGTYFQPSLANATSKAAPNVASGISGSQGSLGASYGNIAMPGTKPFAANLDAQVKPLDVKVSAPDISTGRGRMSAVGQGFKDITSSGDKLFDFAKENYMPIAAVAASMSGGDDMPEEEKGKGMEKYRYAYDRNPIGVASSRSSERDYFPNARYEPTGEYYGASGGLMALAAGGPIEDMSYLNSVGANTGYPMANQMSSTYATSAERPISENIIRPQGDSNIDPYTGEQRFANGGPTTRFAYSGQYGLLPGQDNSLSNRSLGGGTEDLVNFFDPNYFNPRTGMYSDQNTSATPKFSTKAIQQTQETLNPMYQKYFGRDIDPEGLAAYTAKPFSEADLNEIFTGSPERAAREREANLASPEQAADVYERVMGRTPDLAGLEYYAKTNRMTPEEMEKSLRGSDEYFKNLTKPFVPAITYDDNGRASIEGAPKYDPSQYGFAAGGGIADLGGYSDGGRLLKGPGDGVSDSIPAVIGERQPARLADGEFVIPARIVSELGNGSTDAGARKLYAMMDRVQKARRKTTGKSRVAANTKSEKYLPA